jgi:hypothetical protein
VLLFPHLVPLVAFALLAVPANGPLSPVVPVAFEPLVMEAAKFHAAGAVTAVGLGVCLYMEYLNWHLYAWLWGWRRLASVRAGRWVRWGLGQFGRAPFRTVVIFAVTPLPFWVVRSLAILHGYPLGRFLLATALGRLPRLYAYAWLGAALRVPTLSLVGVVVGTAVVAAGIRALRARRIPLRTTPDAGPAVAGAGAPPTGGSPGSRAAGRATRGSRSRGCRRGTRARSSRCSPGC